MTPLQEHVLRNPPRSLSVALLDYFRATKPEEAKRRETYFRLFDYMKARP